MMNLVIIITAKYVFLLSLAISGISFLKSTPDTRRRLIIFSAILLTLAYVLTKLAGALWYNPRPFVLGNFLPLIPHTSDNGFPSDHTVLTMAVAFICLVHNKRTGIVLFLIGLAVGVARVAAGLHHPIDIIASTVIAALSALMTYKVLPHIYRLKL